MKVRIGVGTGAAELDGDGLARLGDDIVELGFDSLWLPEILTMAAIDPLVGLAWAGAHNRRLKLGTTMLVPGRNIVRLAKQLAVLDDLSAGRLLVTFVPGIPRGAERTAVGVPVAERGAVIEDAIGVLRRLWAGETVTHQGPAGALAAVSVSPRPAQEPLEVWLGGSAPASLRRCGRCADGWLPSQCTPAEVAAGRVVVEESAAAAGRTISPEHFGVSLGYSHTPLDDRALAALRSTARGRPLEELIPVGLPALRRHIEAFVEVGFSKFVVRPVSPPADWRKELETLAGAVGDLQT
jgi:probable F420-dependent oxidoreductase